MGILIKNGHILNPPTGTDEVMDLYVAGDRVTKMQKDLAAGADDQVIDASGCYVFPGFIDLHVHLRDPGLTAKEDIETGSRAAAHGDIPRSLPCQIPSRSPIARKSSTMCMIRQQRSG